MQHMLLKELMEALFDCRDQLVAAARQRAAVGAICAMWAIYFPEPETTSADPEERGLWIQDCNAQF